MNLLVDSMGAPLAFVDVKAESAVRAGAREVRTCEECGCTEDRACEGGCFWVTPELCSRCAPTELMATLAGTREEQLAGFDASLGARKVHFAVEAARIGEPGNDYVTRVVAFEDAEAGHIALQEVEFDEGAMVRASAIVVREEDFDAVIDAIPKAREALRAARAKGGG